MPDAGETTPLTYAGSGVDYDPLDGFKRACQREAGSTKGPLAEVPGTRGESAYLVDLSGGRLLGHVEEGLGTKNLVADAVGDPALYFNVGVDTVATIANDLITVGCPPAVIAMHAAVGDAAWFADRERADALARGFAEGCRRAGATWGGGETPALSGLVNPATIVLAGSAVGTMDAADRVRGDVRAGDAMVFLASTGVHTNGLTLCRRIGDRVGYDAGDFGRLLLEPSAIYAGFVAKLREAGVRPRYLVHVTGHGLRKLMRPELPLIYRVDSLPPPMPVFEFIAEHGPVEAREMWATFNMGVGFAAYVDAGDVDATLAAAESAGAPGLGRRRGPRRQRAAGRRVAVARHRVRRRRVARPLKRGTLPGVPDDDDDQANARPGVLAVFPGQFDPITNGHLDVIRRGATLFGGLIVGVGVNPEKSELFTQSERLAMVRDVLDGAGGVAGVRAEAYEGLTADFVRRSGAGCLLRGIRDVTDLRYEFQSALANRAVGGVETLFLMTGDQYALTSSSLIRQVITLGGDVATLRPLVPPAVVERLRSKQSALRRSA